MTEESRGLWAVFSLVALAGVMWTVADIVRSGHMHPSMWYSIIAWSLALVASVYRLLGGKLPFGSRRER